MSLTAPAPTPALYLVDASLYVFRAWHSMPDEFHDADGWPTNAVHGFARFLLDVLEDERPRHVVVAFDEAHDNCFRTALFPAYKANRPPAPDTLKRQFAYCRTLCMVLGLPVLTHPRYAAALGHQVELVHLGVVVWLIDARGGIAHGHRDPQIPRPGPPSFVPLLPFSEMAHTSLLWNPGHAGCAAQSGWFLRDHCSRVAIGREDGLSSISSQPQATNATALGCMAGTEHPAENQNQPRR